MDHDPRFLAGIVLFNRGDFFEAHEVWESLWMETHGPEKPFVQGLIQAAVGVCHFCNGNVGGAVKLYRSSRDYMERFGPRYWDIDVVAFWRQMESCFAPLLREADPERRPAIDETLIPELHPDPAPASWPDPEEFLDKDA